MRLFPLLILFAACTTIPIEEGTVNIEFCPGCEQTIVDLIDSHSDIRCALFDFNDDIIQKLLEKQALIVVDSDNLHGYTLSGDERYAFMHNKFCVFDQRIVLTGSTNPTDRGMHRNNNNIVIIDSPTIAANYLDEFYELWTGEFGDGWGVKHPKVNLSGIMVENYFCPEDECEEQVLRILSSAQKSIHFMTFSFTSDPIGKLILAKASEGISISGIFEKSQNSKYSEYQRLAYLNVTFDNNSANMHNKVFVVDRKIVITGSYNPSKNANENNDENIIIIHDSDIAEEYIKELERIWPR